MAVKEFSVRFAKSKGRKISYTIITGSSEFAHEVIVGWELMGFIAEKSSEGNDGGNSSVTANIAVIRRLIGSANYDSIVSQMTEECETFAEEEKSLENLMKLVMEEVLPKVLASAEKASAAQ